MADYPHDRDWEVPPEERERTANTTHTDMRQPKSQSHPQRTYQRQDVGQLQNQHQRQDGGLSQSPSQSSTPSLFSRLSQAIFGPIIGFIAISVVSLTWSGLLFAGLMVYSALGNPISGRVVLLSVFVWLAGFKVLRDVLLRPSIPETNTTQ